MVSTVLELGKKEGGRESLGRKRGVRAWEEGGRDGELGKKERGRKSLGRWWERGRAWKERGKEIELGEKEGGRERDPDKTCFAYLNPEPGRGVAILLRCGRHNRLHLQHRYSPSRSTHLYMDVPF